MRPLSRSVPRIPIARVRSAVGIGLVIVAALILSGCTTLTTRTPGPLVTVETRGGRCVGGPCGTTVSLDRSGTVRTAAKPPNVIGMVPANAVAALDAAIRRTDFTALKSHPFTGQCPVAFDGQEYVFEFDTPTGIQRMASCEVEVDFGSPLFVALGAALGPFVPLPLT